VLELAPRKIFNSKQKADFGIVYTFIGARALKVDYGAKSPEEAPFIEPFQRPGPSASKASGLISQKRSLKRLRMDRERNFIKREIKRVIRLNELVDEPHLITDLWFTVIADLLHARFKKMLCT
jgi:hypothetical protein